MVQRGWRPIVIGSLVMAMAGVALAGPARAQTQLEGAKPHAQVKVISPYKQVKPEQKFHLALAFDMQEGWHIYWRNGGEVGYPVHLTNLQHKGARLGELAWPSPEVYPEGSGLVSYIYKDRALLLLPVTVQGQVGQTLTWAGTVKWLECQEACIPQQKEVKIEIPIAAQAQGQPEQQERIAKWRQKMPLSYTQEKKLPFEIVRFGWDQPSLQEGKEAIFSAVIRLPDSGGIDQAQARRSCRMLPFVNNARQKFGSQRATPGWEFAVARLAVTDNYDNGRPRQIKFSLAATPQEGALSRHEWLPKVQLQCSALSPQGISLPMPKKRYGQIPALPQGQDESLQRDKGGGTASLSWGNLLLMALFAAIGGLILNIMPCVLPVLSIKIFSLVKHAGEGKQAIVRSSLVFVTGMVATFVALAGAVIVLKFVGQGIGWGFQFQNPYFLLSLALIVTVFSLSFFNVYSLNVPQTGKVNEWASREGLLGSFFQGVLATVLATPCSAPFLGSAMGFAFSQSSWIILVIFVAAGLGMASPYFLLALRPDWLHFVPKPGMWMENFKQLMGFFLVGTLIWVVWLVGGQVGVDGLAYFLFYLLLVSLVVWIGGRMAPLGTSRKKFFVTWGAVLVAIAVLSIYAWPEVLSYKATKKVQPQTKQAADDSAIVWQDYTPSRLAKAREKGRVVFVKFTADWCLTCKFNEKTILASTEVEKALRKYNVLPLTADWTGGNQKVTKLLNSFGRSSVPFYAIYPSRQGKKDKKALTLAEVITTDMVVEAIKKAANHTSKK